MQMPLTALIDIVFLLLIYFLLTTNFLVEEGIKVKLPEARASSAQVSDNITIVIDAAGHSYIDGQQILVKELFDTLKNLLREGKDRLVIVRADRTVVLDKAVKVMDIAKAAGAERLSLATEKKL